MLPEPIRLVELQARIPRYPPPLFWEAVSFTLLTFTQFLFGVPLAVENFD